MDQWIKKLVQYWDIARGRYNIFLVETDADMEACLEVLEAVRKAELNRVAGTSMLDSHAFSGEKLNYVLMGCRDTKTGKVIGCLRLTPAHEVMHVKASRDEYLLDQIPIEFVNQLTVCTRLAVLKPYRKTPAALLLMAQSIRSVLDNGGAGALLVCEPNLFNMYKKLGLRQLGPLHNAASGGYRLPLIFLPDLPYLESIHSPALQWKKGIDFKKYDSICQWYKQYSASKGNQQIGLQNYTADHDPLNMHLILTMGMSDKGRTAFLQNALVVQCHKEDVVVAEHDGSDGIGIVLKGKIYVRADGKKLAEMEPGEVFGEMAMVLNNRRTASIIADADGSEVLLFSVSAYQRLEKSSDQSVFWQNIARILAHKLLEVRKN